MEHFPYRDGQLYAEGVAASEIAAAHGTPCYVYSRAALEEAFGAYQQALADCDHLICYAVKANSNLAVLDVLARLGAGFDIVSGGELERVIAAGGDPALPARSRHPARKEAARCASSTWSGGFIAPGAGRAWSRICSPCWCSAWC